MSHASESVRPVFGLDIGGSLTKVVYFEPDDLDMSDEDTQRMREFIFHTDTYGSTGTRERKRCIYSPHLRGTMHFIKFQTARVRSAIKMMQEYGLMHRGVSVGATGGACAARGPAFSSALLRLS